MKYLAIFNFSKTAFIFFSKIFKNTQKSQLTSNDKTVLKTCERNQFNYQNFFTEKFTNATKKLSFIKTVKETLKNVNIVQKKLSKISKIHAFSSLQAFLWRQDISVPYNFIA